MKQENSELDRSNNYIRSLDYYFIQETIDVGVRKIPEYFSVNRLIYVEFGNIDVCNNKGVICNLSANDLLFIPACKRFYIIGNKKSAITVLRTLRIDLFPKYYPFDYNSSEAKTPHNSIFPIQAKQNLISFYSTIRSFINSNQDLAEFHKIKAQEIFLLLHLNYSKKELYKFFTSISDLKVDFKEMVKEHGIKCANVNELAKSLGYERTYFQTVFKRNFGITPYKWLQLLKSVKLVQFLLQDNFPIKVIAEELGFTSHSHLNTFSKKYFGCTTLTLKKEIAIIDKTKLLLLVDKFLKTKEYNEILINKFFQLIERKKPY